MIELRPRQVDRLAWLLCAIAIVSMAVYVFSNTLFFSKKLHSTAQYARQRCSRLSDDINNTNKKLKRVAKVSEEKLRDGQAAAMQSPPAAVDDGSGIMSWLEPPSVEDYTTPSAIQDFQASGTPHDADMLFNSPPPDDTPEPSFTSKGLGAANAMEYDGFAPF